MNENSPISVEGPIETGSGIKNGNDRPNSNQIRITNLMLSA